MRRWLASLWRSWAAWLDGDDCPPKPPPPAVTERRHVSIAPKQIGPYKLGRCRDCGEVWPVVRHRD